MDSSIIYVIIGMCITISRTDDSYSSQITPRIINGTFARPGQFPYMVVIFYHGQKICGGTIIGRRWILTAAHCLDGMSVSHLTILAGTINSNSRKIKIPAAQAFKHEHYRGKPNCMKNDIGLIKLQKRLKISHLVKRISLNINQLVFPNNTQGLLVGWGHDEFGNYPVNLKYTKIDLWSDEQCGDRYCGDVIVPSHQICVGLAEGGKSFAYGDSGGPLVVEGIQVGIVSWGLEPFGYYSHPGILTRVSAYIHWIYRKTYLKQYRPQEGDYPVPPALFCKLSTGEECQQNKH